MKPQNQAISFRKLLTFLFIVIVVGLVGAFYFGLQQVRTYAIEVTRTTKDAAASGEQIDKLKLLQTQLAQTKTAVEKSSRIFASSSDYQTQAITDLQRYATEAGLTIANTDFGNNTSAGASTREITIKLAAPVSYAKLLRFFELIEDSMPKMQIATLNMSRPSSPDGDTVVVEDIIINIFVR